MRFFFFLLLLNPVMARAQAGGGAVITFTDTLHDFGRIAQGASAVYCFQYKNTGSQPLIIHQCITSDPHVATYPKEPLAPGGTACIRVEMPTTGRQGPFYKSVLVESNSSGASQEGQGRRRIYIRGDILPASGPAAAPGNRN